MARRVRIWAGAVCGAAILAGLVVYLSLAGLDRADKWASVIGLFIALAGLGVSVFELVAPRAEAGPPVGGAPPGLVNLPSRPQLFVGREDELARLDTALSGTGGVVVVAVHGLGGIGKSSLAARYAVTHAARFDLVWWITADTAAAVRAGLAGLAVGLRPELAESLPLDALAERAIGWLAARDGWLLVLDDVTDPADVEGLLGRTLAGRILVTSRLGEGWQRLNAQIIRLDVMTEAQAVDLLTRIGALGRPGADLDGAAELVAVLGYLPLAVEQAAAYIHQNHLSPRAYRDLLAEDPAVMYGQRARGSAAERTIARIWRVSLDGLADVPLAGTLLRMLAWYGPDPIPRSLLDAAADAPRVQEAVGALAAYNLITVDGATVAVHPLVQAVARTPDPDAPHRREADIDSALDLATRLLDEALPDDQRNPSGWPRWRALSPHIDALTRNAPAEGDTRVTAHLLHETGLFLKDQGAVERATAYYQRALTVFERTLGADHPDTLTCRTNLAAAYRTAGDLGRAIPLFEQALTDRERVFGADHPYTLNSRHNLAGAYQEAGDLPRAIPMFEQTVSALERALGPDHPYTLTTRHNLAGAYQAAGDLGRAITLLEQTVSARERVLGPDHPSTLTTRNNLAYAYRSAGDLGRAIPLLERTLADCERVLGTEHPLTWRVRRHREKAR